MTVTPETFGSRFAVECVGDGAVLVDLESGGYYQLNRTAAMTCSVLSEGISRDGVVERLASRLQVAPEIAQSILGTVLENLTGATATEEPFGPFRYRRQGPGYVLQEGEKTILAVDVVRRELARIASDPLRFPMIEYVRAVTPKLCAVAGVTILHASACTLGERSIAFSGRSGAGKTTTVRALVAAGASPVSEDLLVLQEGPLPTFYLEGEARAHEWVAGAATRLGTGAVSAISFAGLAEIGVGPSRRLHEVCFLEAERRSSSTLSRRRLEPVEGLLALLHNAFLGEEEPGRWRRHLRRLRDLGANLDLFEANVPNGLEALSREAKAYVAKSAS